MAEFVDFPEMRNDGFFAATADDRRAGSPTIAWKVRPGGSLAFSEPMTFSPGKGGWINNSQLRGGWEPGVIDVNRNLKVGSPTASSAESIDDEAKYRAAIKLSPTDQLIRKAQSENPFSFPAYWDGDTNKRGWYSKPGQPGGPKNYY